ncbi:hypothetical protein NLJ89_g8849 [Agrocybe chaxingu]|uniref:Microbial-type PARG catalytic domain-containing protein n=1 Tax=Agrocybe chaxingu TaxID=84603 RepID=A0A9W8JU46_9AGAR|nr:hypothetical protein NLJ89_g8849 [Agrocybe chaxingu]
MNPSQDTESATLPPGTWPDHAPGQPTETSHTPRASSSHPNRGRYYPRHPAYRLSRDELREFANLTLDTIDEGSYIPPGSDTPYDLVAKILYTNENTTYSPPDDPDIGQWETVDLGEKKDTKIIIGEYSTLVGARKLHEMVGPDPDVRNETIGVLNFASAKKPGGGFINGSQAQEESIARASTLYPSLISPAAKEFYQLYAEDPDNAFYTHAMVYSPAVVLMRNDKGDWKSPIEMDVLTSAAVNAGDVRKQVEWHEEMRQLRARVQLAEAARREEEIRQREEDEVEKKRLEAEQAESNREEGGKQTSEQETPEASTSENANTASPTCEPEVTSKTATNAKPSDPLSSPEHTPIEPITFASSSSEPPQSPTPLPDGDPFELAELEIDREMYERIARILLLFHRRGARHLVLGSFGTGVFQNRVELVAGIFKDLLYKNDEGMEGKFYGAFDTVLFAILGGSTVRTFQEIFRDAAVVDEEGEGSDIEGMKDAADFPDFATSRTSPQMTDGKESQTEGGPSEPNVKTEENYDQKTESAAEKKIDRRLDEVIAEEEDKVAELIDQQGDPDLPPSLPSSVEDLPAAAPI